MRPEARASIILASLALAIPAGAVPAAPGETVAAEPQETATLRSALERVRAGDCAGALARLDPLLPGTRDPGVRRDVQLMRVTCLGTVGRTAEVAVAYDELAALSPDDPVVRNLGVLIAADAGNFVLAGERLAAFAERRPRDLALLTGENWRAISIGLVQAEQRALRRRISIALARADWQPADRPEIAESVASDAIGGLLAEREPAEARALLARINAPEILLDMAIDRSFQPIWPDVEAAMGPEGATVIDAYAARALDTNARNPADRAALRDAVHAYLLLGRPAEAVTLAQPVEAHAEMDAEAVSIVLMSAQALAVQGRADAAIARLKPLAAPALARVPNAPSAAVVLAEFYHDAGRSEEELALAREMLGGDRAFSAWGRGWLKRSEVCALTALGRAADARVAGDALIASAKDNEAAAIEGLLCAGRSDEAAKIAVAVLGGPDGASLIADQFQPSAALWSAPPSRLRALWTAFLGRADVRAAFERVARVLPRALWPGKSPRAIPRLPDSPPASDTV